MVVKFNYPKINPNVTENILDTDQTDIISTIVFSSETWQKGQKGTNVFE